MLQSCVQRCSTCFDSYQALSWAKSAVIFLLNHPCVTMGIADIAVLVNTSTYFLPTSCFFVFNLGYIHFIYIYIDICIYIYIHMSSGQNYMLDLMPFTN